MPFPVRLRQNPHCPGCVVSAWALRSSCRPREGQAPLDIPRWTGEKTLPPAVASPDALNLDLLSFDEQGMATVAGISADTLSKLTGANVLPQLTPDQLALIKSLGIEDLTIDTTSGGIDIGINGQPLPSIAFDSESLQSVLNLVGPMLGDSAGMVESLLPMLTERGCQRRRELHRSAIGGQSP